MDTEAPWGWGLRPPPSYSASFPKCCPQKVRGGSPSRGLGLHRVSGRSAGEAIPFLWGPALPLPISLLRSTLGLTFVIRAACSCWGRIVFGMGTSLTEIQRCSHQRKRRPSIWVTKSSL